MRLSATKQRPITSPSGASSGNPASAVAGGRVAVDAPAFQGRIVWVLGLLALAVFGFFAGVQVSLRQEAADGAVLAEAGHDLLLRLREARSMREEGLLSDTEFEAMRRHVLGLPPLVGGSHHGAAFNQVGGTVPLWLQNAVDGPVSYPTLQGVAYSPLKHPLQGGSILTSSCPNKDPAHKLVFIKTHKTGSSTLTNLFHRFGYKYGLNFALPKDNMFYGWPAKGEASVKNLEPIGVYQEPYDVYVSAHAVYSPEQQARVVPGATYITILRSPVSHFRSAWKYWQIPQGIASRGGPFDMTPEEFFEDKNKWDPFIGGQRNLIFNSFSYDLGFDRKTVNALRDQNSDIAIKSVIDEVEAHFRIVLITDYMAESLLMMKRELCWPLEDVIFGSMKVSKGTHRPKTLADNMKDPLFEAITDYNWLDTRLFNHFNESLWRRIDQYKKADAQMQAASRPLPMGYLTWEDELAEFKAKIDAFTKRCEPLNYQHEDRHRAELEKLPPGGPNDDERACHLAYTDSKGYCKTLKREQGAPIDEIECYAQRPLTQFGILRTNNGADEAFFGTVARRAHGFKHALLVYDTTSAEAQNRLRLSSSDEQTDDTKRLPLKYRAVRESKRDVMLGIRGMRFHRDIYKQLTGNGPNMNTFVVQHPIAAFLQGWDRLNMPERLRRVVGKPLSFDIASFVSSYGLSEQRDMIEQALELNGADLKEQAATEIDDYCGQKRLINVLWCRFGFDPDARILPRDAIKRFRSSVKWDFQVPMLAELMDESLILIRQTICWRTRDFVFVNEALWKTAQLPEFVKQDKKLFSAIAALIAVDMALYGEIEAWFWQMANQRPAWDDELQLFKEARPKALAECPANIPGLLKIKRELTYAEKGCVLTVMNEEEYTEFFVRAEAPSATAILDLKRKAERGECRCADKKDVFKCDADPRTKC
eukprot:INCI15042.1.p1 GENE.INCI15042.1~~INCI15042.1.p1  ORF type:complete len:931 (+),score=134.07 INCI15042.1:213-3005(+)